MKLTSSAKIVFTLIIIFCVGSVGLAEKRPAALGSPEPVKAEPANIKFPYIGEVTGNQINIRSGAGMNYYSCGKISSPLRVVVVGQKYIWSKILPPQGSFSWIFKQYVQVDANTPNVGLVTADNVRVYAGSEGRDPMRSDSVQILLPKGQKVRIIGQPVGDYYKIAPPEGACLWASSQYIKYIRSADELEIKIPETQPAQPEELKPEVVIEQIEVKNRSTEKYYQLQQQFEAEKAKPIEKQDYSVVKSELEKLSADPNSGDAGNYARYLLKSIDRCELALLANADLKKDNAKLNKTLAGINETYEKRKENITNLGKYAITGKFKPSMVYKSQTMVKRFLIVDDKDNPVCFAEPTGEAAVSDFEPYYEKKVGLIGNIGSDAQSNLALVSFEKIELLEKPEPKK